MVEKAPSRQLLRSGVFHWAVRFLFLIPGLINLAPVAGVLGSEQLQSLYGLRFEGIDELLLLQHRAVLFGLLGTLLVAAAFRPRLRMPATIAGCVSMISYMILAMPLSLHTVAIQRVFWVDAAAVVLLALGGALSARVGDRAA